MKSFSALVGIFPVNLICPPLHILSPRKTHAMIFLWQTSSKWTKHYNDCYHIIVLYCLLSEILLWPNFGLKSHPYARQIVPSWLLRQLPTSAAHRPWHWPTCRLATTCLDSPGESQAWCPSWESPTLTNPVGIPSWDSNKCNGHKNTQCNVTQPSWVWPLSNVISGDASTPLFLWERFDSWTPEKTPSN